MPSPPPSHPLRPMRGVVSLNPPPHSSDSTMMEQHLLEQQRRAQQQKRRCASCTSLRCTLAALIFASLGLLLLLLSTFLPSVIQSKLDAGIDSYTSIGPKAFAEQSDGFRSWADWSDKDAIPVYQTVYMYHIENPDAVLTGAKPNVTEKGPYVYRYYKKKIDISFLNDPDNRQLVQFREWQWWEYDWEASGRGLNPFADRYTLLNLPFLAVTSVMLNTVDPSDMMYLGNLGWGLINNTDVGGVCPGVYDKDFDRLFVQDVTVQQYLFGFSSCITQLILNPSGLSPAGMFPGVLGPNIGPNNITEAKVISLTALDSVYTGEDDPDYSRQYYTWKETTSLNISLGVVDMKEYAIWGSARANRVYGSAGMKWQKGLKDGSTVVAWVDELMRHAPLLNANDLHVKSHGIDLLRYVLDPSLLLNATQVPSNADYYAHRFNGLQNMSIPKQTLAIFMSKPHFLDADANLIDNVVGMTPAVREEHDTMIDVEPLSGVTMRAAKRLQVNYALKPWSFSGLSGQFNWYSGVGKMSPLGGQLSLVPVAWVEESAEIDSDKAAQFRSKVYGATNAIKYVKLLGGIFGAVAIAVAVHMLLVAQSRARDEAEENFAKHHATNY